MFNIEHMHLLGKGKAMKTYAVTIKRHALVPYYGEIKADSPEAAAVKARQQWEEGTLNGWERDSSQLEEFAEIDDIHPDYDVEEVESIFEE